MILHAIDKNAISLKKRSKKYLVLVTYLLENFENQQNKIIFVNFTLNLRGNSMQNINIENHGFTTNNLFG